LFRSTEEAQTAPPCLPPPGAALLLRALLKRPRAGAAGQVEPLASEFMAAVPGRATIDTYNAALGFAPGSTPLAWYYLMVQRAHLATMLAPAFPYRIAGMIHVENALLEHRAAPAGPLRLSTRLHLLPTTASGAVYCSLATEGSCNGEAVFACTSKYLAVRGKMRGSGTPAPQAAPGEIAGSWYLPPSAGRAYAHVSGDWNPIHLARWTARLMGLRQPIIHGMHSVGKACALLERASGRRVRAVDVRFRAPVPLGASVDFAYGATPGTYALYCEGVLAAEGSFQLW
jgi:hypothetical protein